MAVMPRPSSLLLALLFLAPCCSAFRGFSVASALRGMHPPELVTVVTPAITLVSPALVPSQGVATEPTNHTRNRLPQIKELSWIEQYAANEALAKMCE